MRLKALALMPRRPDLGRGQFRDYYETRHAPLALRYLRFHKYVRNHLITAPDIGFDCISEFWPQDLARTSALMQGKVGERLREDERQFTDQQRIVSSPCNEVLLAGAPLPGDASGVVKLALLLRTTLDAATLVGTLETWARAQPAPARTVTLDSLVDVPHPAFPYDAIVWLHAIEADRELAIPAGIELAARVVTRTEETSAAVLALAGRETLS